MDTAARGILTPDTVSTHCQHCLVSTITPVHCHTCSVVVFCSNDCRTAAMETYHKYECCLGLWDLNRLQYEKCDNKQSCSSVLMIIRFFTQKRPEYFVEMREKFSKIIDGKDDTTEDMQYLSSDYSRLLGLVSHQYEFSTLLYFS